MSAFFDFSPWCSLIATLCSLLVSFLICPNMLCFFRVWIMNVCSVGDRSVFSNAQMASNTQPSWHWYPEFLFHFLFSPVSCHLYETDRWNWRSCFHSPALIAFVSLSFLVLWGRMRGDDTHTHLLDLFSYSTFIISIMFLFKKCSESCNALTQKRCLLSQCSDFESEALSRAKILCKGVFNTHWWKPFSILIVSIFFCLRIENGSIKDNFMSFHFIATQSNFEFFFHYFTQRLPLNHVFLNYQIPINKYMFGST